MEKGSREQGPVKREAGVWRENTLCQEERALARAVAQGVATVETTTDALMVEMRPCTVKTRHALSFVATGGETLGRRRRQQGGRHVRECVIALQRLADATDVFRASYYILRVFRDTRCW